MPGPDILEPVVEEVPAKPDPRPGGSQRPAPPLFLSVSWNRTGAVPFPMLEEFRQGYIMRRSIFRATKTCVDELQAQIADLGSELNSLRKSVASRSADRYVDARDGAGDLIEDLWSGIMNQLPSRKQVPPPGRATQKPGHA